MNKRGIIKIVIVLIILVIVFLWASFYFINKHKEEVVGEQPIIPAPAQESQAIEEQESPPIQGEIVSGVEEQGESAETGSGGGASGGGGGGSGGSSGETADDDFTGCEYIKNAKSPECYPD
jgi:uncharacterized membrane protein YgcG